MKISHKFYLHVAPKRPSVWQIFCGKQSILVHELIGRALNICNAIFLLKKLNMGGFAKFFFFILRYSRKTKRKIHKLMIKVTKVLFEYCSKIACLRSRWLRGHTHFDLFNVNLCENEKVSRLVCSYESQIVSFGHQISWQCPYKEITTYIIFSIQKV